MIKKVLLGLLVLILLLAVIGALLSDRYRCSRSLVVRAPAEKVFALIGDLKAWPAWEPFSSENANMKTTLGATTTGVGASQSWAGAGDQGRLTFTRCDPKEGVEFDLVFTNGGHESPAKSWMHMTPREAGATELAWGIEGELNMPVLGGWFALAADRRMGPIFERGLKRIKEEAER